MASSSAPSQVICASFNQDNSLFSVGTKEGVKIFDSRNGRLCFENNLGGLNIVEMLFGTSLLAIVGTGEQVPQEFLIVLLKIGLLPVDCLLLELLNRYLRNFS